MRIDEQVKAVADGLTTWAASHSTRVSVARDPFDSLELLSVGPQDALAIVQWAGDAPRDDEFGAPVDSLIDVIVGAGLGLDAQKDWRLVAGKGSRPAVLQRVDEARAYLLALVFDSDKTYGRLTYRGCEPVVTPDGVPLAAYRLKFALTAGLEIDDAA